MTTPHTIESPTEYTLDEQIAALKKLGADFTIPQSEHLRKGINIRFKEYKINRSFVGDTIELAIEAAHEFLLTDESAWMAMKDVLWTSEFSINIMDRRPEIAEITGQRYFCEAWKPGLRFEATAYILSAAVYDCYMQFIRKELK